MSEPPIQTSSEFDAYAAEYDAQLARGISISGEDKNYFARGRVVWLARCLARLQKHPRTALDFGCGTGSATPFLLNQLKLNSLVGWTHRFNHWRLLGAPMEIVPGLFR